MIVQEKISDNQIRTTSSEGKNVEQVESGLIFESAVDSFPCPYTYAETDEYPPEPEPTAEEILDILLGGESE